MKRALIVTIALSGCIGTGGCGYVGQVKQATDMIKAMKPDVEKRNEELKELADPTTVPTTEPPLSP